MFYVYILLSERSKKTYVGQTEDLQRRIREHNTPDHNIAKFTSKHAGPWVLIHREEFQTRGEAMKREKWFKSGVGREWIKANLKP